LGQDFLTEKRSIGGSSGRSIMIEIDQKETAAAGLGKTLA
jgi:hypothetical protein